MEKIIIDDKKNKYALIILSIVLVLVSNKWFIEGILDATILEALIFTLAFIALLVVYKFKLISSNLIWILYIVNIFFSVFINSPTPTILGRAMIMISLVLIAMVVRLTIDSYDKLLRVLFALAIFHGLAVIFQYFFGVAFNSVYFPLLKRGNLLVANSYFSKGYYFGFLYSPHEVAGIISFTLAGLILKNHFIKKGTIFNSLIYLFLFVTLFLTGKKAIPTISLSVLILLIFILNSKKRQWHKIVILIIVVVVILLLVQNYIINNPDNVIFYRITLFFKRMAQGDSIDSGRRELQSLALEKFRTNKLFGIGWYKFVTNTFGNYGYETGHQVNLDYLQWLTETGIIGFILNMIPVLITFYHSYYLFKKIKLYENDRDKWIISFAFYVQLFILAYAFIETPFYDIFYFAIYIFTSALINMYYYKLKENIQKNSNNLFEYGLNKR